MRSALENLKLASLDVIYSGDQVFQLGPKVRAVPLGHVLTDIAPL